MKKRDAAKGILLFAAFLIGMRVGGQTVFDIRPEFDEGQPGVELRWQTEPMENYRLLTRPSMTEGEWTPVDPTWMAASNLVLGTSVFLPGPTAFFCVERKDQKPPTYRFISPLRDSVAVPRHSSIVIAIQDESPLDLDAIVFHLDDTEYTLASSELSYEGGLLQYTNAASALGEYGSTVSVQVAASDIHGNNSTSAVSSLRLEVEPVANDNMRVIGVGLDPQQTRGHKDVIGPLAADRLVLVETHEDRLVFEYEGNHGLEEAQLLASSDPNNIFYRRIIELDDDPTAGQIVAYTVDARLEEFFTAGSINTASMQWNEYTRDALDLQVQAIGPLWEAGWGIGFNQSGTIFPIDFENDNLKVEGNLGTWAINSRFDILGNFELTGNLMFIPVFPHWVPEVVMDRCDIVFDGDLTVALAPSLLVEAAASENPTVPLISPWHHVFGAMAGPVPVWVELVFELDLGLDIDASASGSFYGGVQLDRAIEYHLQLRDAQWSQLGDGDTGWVITPIPIETTLQGEAMARVYIQPKITVYVYSLVGAYTALEPYLRYDGLYQLLPEYYYRHELTAGMDFTVGMDVRFWPEDMWGPLPRWDFPLLSEQVFFDEGPSCSPVIVAGPHNASVSQGNTAVFWVAADGTPPLNYRWHHNGVDIGRRTAEISFTADTDTAGTYSVEVYNVHGSDTASATLAVLPSGPAPAGMVPIPKGTNSGTDPDFGAYSLTVNSFYMDATPVTKAQWDAVYDWATHPDRGPNVYSFEDLPDGSPPGRGKASNHPVCHVNWYDVVKWCNARSEMEAAQGRSPVYYVGGSVYRTGQHDNVVQTSAAGYRLPTEIEWEYAARGGLSGKRFPWGDTISHQHANYCASPDGTYSYEAQQGYTEDTLHPTWNDGNPPYTSPVGWFASNNYDLYDMAGNVREWCFNWVGSTVRVHRGGSGNLRADRCRVSQTDHSRPNRAAGSIGFRAVLPPGL